MHVHVMHFWRTRNDHSDQNCHCLHVHLEISTQCLLHCRGRNIGVGRLGFPQKTTSEKYPKSECILFVWIMDTRYPLNTKCVMTCTTHPRHCLMWRLYVVQLKPGVFIFFKKSKTCVCTILGRAFTNYISSCKTLISLKNVNRSHIWHADVALPPNFKNVCNRLLQPNNTCFERDNIMTECAVYIGCVCVPRILRTSQGRAQSGKDVPAHHLLRQWYTLRDYMHTCMGMVRLFVCSKDEWLQWTNLREDFLNSQNLLRISSL